MAQATHPRLRASLIGTGLMTSAVAIAIYVVPAAEAPDEPPREEGCHLPDRTFTVHEKCGGDTVPFLTHEHREAAGPVTRFELFPGGEWRLTKIGTSDLQQGCIDAASLREANELATAATWKRQPSSTTCDVIPSGTEAWLVDGVERLAFNVCDLEQPDPRTEKVIERMLAIEGSFNTNAIQHGDCPRGALACYEWLGALWASTLPESKFVIEDSGAWELTQRDVQSDEITVHKTGTLTTVEVTALRDRIAHASWKLVEQQHCTSSNEGLGTVAVHGHAVTYGPCSGQLPDRSTQIAIDQLFAIYRSALGSNSHI
jgi:hypothetical protein